MPAAPYVLCDSATLARRVGEARLTRRASVAELHTLKQLDRRAMLNPDGYAKCTLPWSSQWLPCG